MVLIYFELLLKAFAGNRIWDHLIYPILFGIGLGLIFSCITTFFSAKVNKIISLVVLFGTGLLFIVECLIFRSFQFYMSFSGIGSVTNDVTGDYMQTVIQAIVSSIPIIVLFFLPGILYWVFWKKYLCVEKVKKHISAIILAGGILVTVIGVLWANSGSISSKYTSEYQFTSATQNFGLISSMQLDIFYGIFGNSASENLVIV